MKIPSTRLPRNGVKQAGHGSKRSRSSYSTLLSLDSLEQYSRDLASSQKEEAGYAAAKPLLAQVKRSVSVLEAAYVRLSEVARKQLSLMPGDEWLLDNYHIVHDTAAEVEVDLPRTFYLQLPRVSSGPWGGYPRVYALACELILHSDGNTNPFNIEALVRGYQSITPLTMGELWALPATLRLALVEHLADLAEDMLERREQFTTADQWAERIMGQVDALSGSPGATVAPPRELLDKEDLLTPTFEVRLFQHLREAMPTVAPVLRWIEMRWANRGTSQEEVTRSEFNSHAATQVSVSNTITSMRAISAVDWPTFVERHSATEALLRMDPAGVYPEMDFATRDRYRHMVERLSKRSGKTEGRVAQLAVDFAREAQAESPQSPRLAHVGYYLIDHGVYKLRRAIGYKSRLGEQISRASRAYRTAFYLAAIAFATFLIMGVAVLFVLERERPLSLFWAMAALLLTLLPASEFAVRLVDQVVTLLLPPRVLPKIERAVKSRGHQAAVRVSSSDATASRNCGYQVRKVSSQSSLITAVRTCRSRCAPSGVHCICCFLTMRLLITWLMVDSAKPVLIRSPLRYRSP
jgi:cyclic beta-1,2-glucan synthetase